MAADGLSVEELKDKIGTELEPVVYEIEKGMLKRFAQAVGDPNPLWQDDEYASKSSFGGSIVPPSFLRPRGLARIVHRWPRDPSQTIIHATTELNCYQPVRPGDVITATTRIAAVRQRQSEAGKTAFVNFDITYKNQRQEVVAKCRQMAIIRQTELAEYEPAAIL